MTVSALLAMIEEKDAEIARLDDVIARLYVILVAKDAEIARFIDANFAMRERLDANFAMRERLAAAEAVVEAARRVTSRDDRGPVTRL